MSCEAGANRIARWASQLGAGIAQLANKRAFYAGVGLGGAGLLGAGLIALAQRQSARRQIAGRRNKKEQRSKESQEQVTMRPIPQLPTRTKIGPTSYLSSSDRCVGCQTPGTGKQGAWYSINGRAYCQDCAPEAARQANVDLIVPERERAGTGSPARESATSLATAGPSGERVRIPVRRGGPVSSRWSSPPYLPPERRVETRLAPLTAMAMNVVGPRNEPARKATGALVGATAGVTAIAMAGSSRVRGQAMQALAAGGRLAGSAAVSLLPHAGTARLAIKATDKVTSAVGSGVGALSKTGPAGEVMQEKRKLFFFKSKTPVSLWKSSLTPLINKRDVMTVRGKNIVSSRGVMFETGGKTWHQGTSVVKMAEGQKRTITHLQSMNMPASHYYFDRPVSNENSVGIATGKIKYLSVNS